MRHLMSALVADESPSDSFHALGPGPRFPYFRSHYCSASVWSLTERMNQETEASTSAASPTTWQRPALSTLDLRSIPMDDSAPSETQQRRQKYLFFEKQCSEVSPGLFLSGDSVAKNRETLREAGVTHVLNCVGYICKEYFKDELTYRTLYLQGMRTWGISPCPPCPGTIDSTWPCWFTGSCAVSCPLSFAIAFQFCNTDILG